MHTKVFAQTKVSDVLENILKVRPFYTLYSSYTKACIFLTYREGIEKLSRRTHHKADTLYKADKDFAPNLLFSCQILLKVISIKWTLS